MSSPSRPSFTIFWWQALSWLLRPFGVLGIGGKAETVTAFSGWTTCSSADLDARSGVLWVFLLLAFCFCTWAEVPSAGNELGTGWAPSGEIMVEISIL